MESKNLSPPIGALALAKSLFPHFQNVEDMDEFLLFPPDLFAFTSLILSVTGAYRLIVSPPRAISDNESRREIWMPTEDENMLDFSEFNQDSSDDFKDVLSLINQLFMVKDHKISEFLNKRIGDDEREKIKELYKKIKTNKLLKVHNTYKTLERETSTILNRIIKEESFYHDPDAGEVFHNANLSVEVWELLEQWEDVIKTDMSGSTKRLNRLLLEAVYPNEIETSLTWDKRVRKAGIEWRNNLTQKFDETEEEKFEEIKTREKLNELETLIENLENFEEIIRKRNEYCTKSDEVYKARRQKKEKIIENLLTVTKLTEEELSIKKNRLEIIKQYKTEKEKEIFKRREEIKQIVDDEKYVPKILKRYWKNFKEEVDPLREGDIRKLLCDSGSNEERKDHWQRFISLVSLHAIADETCAGWGIRGPLKVLREGLRGGKAKSRIQSYAENLLKKYGSLATINKDRCRVLPKRHTAEVGITLRSISCNLSFHRSSVEVKWKLSDTPTPWEQEQNPLTSLNVLLLPIPLEIHTTDFRKKTVPVKSHQKSQEFFEYEPDISGFDVKEFQDRIEEILDEARKEVGRIDLVVLPEISIHESRVDKLEEKLLEKQPYVTAYIAGVRESGDRFNRNAVYFKVAEQKNNKWLFNPEHNEEEKRLKTELDKIKEKKGRDSEEYRNKEERLLEIRKDYAQYKHHRWKLDRSQIVQYQLGGALSPTKSWWEAIKIGNREVNFINIGEKMTVCPLICEDLARQDPIADLIRTVGPTLVVAILMDGPQILQRWAGKYASVLGDDPGSAVITLTSYGMVKRSLVQGTQASRVIALWSSPDSKREIELEEEAEAILLSLSLDERKEKSSDGREEMSGTPSLTLAGIRQIKLPDFKKAKRVLKG